MTKAELDKALEIAKATDIDLSNEWGQIDIFDGFALPDFPAVTCTVRQVAALIRWQCFNLGGGIDAEALNEIAVAGRRKFSVLMTAE